MEYINSSEPKRFQGSPGRFQAAPKITQDGPKSHQGLPKTPCDHPKKLHKGNQEPPKTLPTARGAPGAI